MASRELLDGLNHALNREVSTFLRYILQTAAIKGMEWAPVRALYEADVADEVGHAQYLANKIVMLGGTPKLDPDLTPPKSDVREMMKYDIEQERIDTENYAKLAEMAKKEGLFELKLKMEEQSADEAEHGEALRRLLG